jgi:uncharacterized tellurite resistance protein B-like protein
MLEQDISNPSDGPRELIARLGTAVMIADGHVTEAELGAVGGLRELGLGPLSTYVEAEIQRAMHAPIDVAQTAAALADAAPHAGAVIISALAQIAASDRALARREMEVVTTVADVFGLSAEETAQAIRAATLRYGAVTEQPRAAGPSNIPDGPARSAGPQTPAAQAIETSGPRTDRDRALPVLGLPAGASAQETDAAYLALIRRYDPAAIADLGPEFAALALQKLMAITAAYITARGALVGH